MNKLNIFLNYMFFCHRLPERSFFYKGKQFPLCARCTGMLIGYFLGIIYLFLNNQVNFILIGLLFIPMAIDGVGQYYGYWISTNFRRLLTGILGGIATLLLISTAITFGFESGQTFAKFMFEK